MTLIRAGWFVLLALVLCATPALAACPAPAAGSPLPREAVAAPLDWAEWRVAADAMATRLRTTEVSSARIVFLGDSITQSWQPNLFQNFYGHRGALNLGVGGDTTQSMLWRLDHGHWPARLQPQVIVLLIGTNNIGTGNRPEDVALGVGQVIARLQRLAPQARILLLGVLPRGITAADPMRAPITRLNQLIAPCADGRRVLYTEPGPLMLDGQGTLFDWIAYDWLHLTLTGYAILSTAIEAPLRMALQR
jgi:lysophospholipase L1-like esterase